MRWVPTLDACGCAPACAPARVLLAGAVISGLLVVAIGFVASPQQGPGLRAPQASADPFANPPHVNGYLFAAVPYHDTSRQRWVYRILVCVIAGVILGSYLFSVGSRLDGRPRPKWSLLADGVHLVLWTALFFQCLAPPYSAWRTCWISIPLLLALLWLYRRQNSFLGRSLGLLTASCLLAYFTIPPLFGWIDLSRDDWNFLVFLQHHFALVLGQADRLAAGQVLFDEVRPMYGILLHILAAGFQRHVRPLAMGDYVHLMQALQVVFLILAVYVLWHYACKRWLAALLGLVFLLPWYHGGHPCILYPNVSAWRVLCFPLALIVLWHGRKLTPAALSFTIGLVSGLAILVNPESGLAALAGLLVYPFFRQPLRAGAWWRDLSLRLGMFVLGLGAALLALGVAGLGALGYWPDLTRVHLLFANLIVWASTGVGGAPYTTAQWGPLPFVLFFHAAFVLLVTAFKKRSDIGHKEAIRAAAAAMLMVWFAYYFNRPHPWHLCSFFFLYAFLAYDLLRLAFIGWKRLRFRNSAAVLATAALVWVILPSMIFSVQEGLEEWQRSRVRASVPEQATAKLLSGVFLPTFIAEELASRADFIQAVGRKGPVIYLTTISYFIPSLSRVFPPLPAGDVCFETVDRPHYDELLRRIIQAPVDDIFFDLDENCAWSGFFMHMRGDLADHFEKAEITGGWERWRRRQPNSP